MLTVDCLVHPVRLLMTAVVINLRRARVWDRQVLLITNLVLVITVFDCCFVSLII